MSDDLVKKNANIALNANNLSQEDLYLYKNKEDLIKIIKHIESIYNNHKSLNDNENEIYSSKAKTNIKFSCIANTKTNELNIYFAGTKKVNIKDINSDIYIVKKAYSYETNRISGALINSLPGAKYIQSVKSFIGNVFNFISNKNNPTLINNVITEDLQEQELKTIFENFISNVDDFSKYSKITISGHSLGGHFANLIYFQLKEHFKNQEGGQGLINKLSVINIDGAADGYLKQEKKNLYEKSDNNKIHNIVIGDNLINSFAAKLGKQYNLIDKTKIYDIKNLAKFHSLKFIGKTIKNKVGIDNPESNNDFNTENHMELPKRLDIDDH